MSAAPRNSHNSFRTLGNLNIGYIKIIPDGGIFGKANDASAISENHQVVPEYLPVQQFDKCLGAFRFFVLASEPLHPLCMVAVLSRGRRIALVMPMGRSALFGLPCATARCATVILWVYGRFPTRDRRRHEGTDSRCPLAGRE